MKNLGLFFEYQDSARLLAKFPFRGNQFYTLLMAAMREADTDNRTKLSEAFPDVYNELFNRYNAPGGKLEGEY